MNIIKAWRKGASKPTICSVEDFSLLSLCQIFESTDDVSHYTVAQLNHANYSYIDRYLEDNNFLKWKPENK